MCRVDVVLGYLDPGSGSLILQVLVGGVAAVGVAARMWWGSVKDRLRPGRKQASSE
jgi:hypothetical protein